MKLPGIRYRQAKHFGGRLTPRGIVLHETASSLTKFNVVNYFQGGSAKVSAHFIIERDGTVTQMVPLDRVAYHAGRSRWGDINGCNSAFIGVELVGPGKLDERGIPWYKRPISEPIEHKATPEHGDGYWLPFTPEQIDAAVRISRACCDEFETCNEIVTHWQISPGRKIDPHPLLDLDDFKRRVFEGDGPADESTRPPEKEPLVSEDAKTAAKVVGTVGAAGAGGASVIPPVPATITQSAEGVTAWQGVGETFSAFVGWGASNPLTLGAIVMVCAALWVIPIYSERHK